MANLVMVVAVTTLCFAGCGPIFSVEAQHPRGQGDHATLGSLPPDSLTFRTIVEEAAHGRDGFVRIDPRILTATSHFLEVRYTRVSAEPEAVVIARQRVLGALGVPEADVLHDWRCEGTSIMPGDPPPQPECPREERFHSVAISEPRSGAPYHPDLGIDERRDDDRPGYVASVRVAMRLLGPRGSTGHTDESVFRKDADGRWVLDDVVTLVFVD